MSANVIAIATDCTTERHSEWWEPEGGDTVHTTTMSDHPRPYTDTGCMDDCCMRVAAEQRGVPVWSRGRCVTSMHPMMMAASAMGLSQELTNPFAAE
jgi:hypothetical protein